MKKFTFKLQRLLEIREKKEEEARIALAKVSGEYQKVVNEKAHALDQVSQTRKRLSKDKDKKLTLQALQAYDRLSQDVDLAVVELDRQIAARKKIMDEKLAIYTKKKQDKRAVEILKEKALARYEEETQRTEQKEMDEIAKNIYLQHQEQDRG